MSKDENAKGSAVQAQIKLWEQLLGARIRFQRILGLINRLPQTEEDRHRLSIDNDPSSVQQEEEKYYDQCQRLLKSTLDRLIEVQDLLLKRNDILASDSTEKPIDHDSDEEIVSSSDEDEEKPAEKKRIKRRKFNELDEYSDFLAERNSAMKPFRDQTVLKWFEKTRLASGRFSKSSFSAFETNALQQIEQILQDRDRLIKRTQMKRSKYFVLGKNSRNEGEIQNHDALDEQEYDEEIFDDDDFYQQLLRELIEQRTVGITDPVALSRQWLELQRLRSKSKKKRVDQKASKGRKCRYELVPKLVNFMAPMDRCLMTDEARDELFASLFESTS